MPYVIKNIESKTEDLALYYSTANDDTIVFSADAPSSPLSLRKSCGGQTARRRIRFFSKTQ